MKMLIQKVPMEGIELSEWFIMQDCTKTTKTFKIENKNSKNQSISMETLVSLERKIFNLSKENLATVVELTMELFDMNFPYSYNLLICNLVYFAFYSQRNISDLYLSYLETIQTKEKEINQNITPIINVFCDNIKKINSQESNYLIEKMIEHNLVSANITNDIKSKYFAHFKTEKENIQKYYYDPFSDAFLINYKKLLMNDWELHKKLIKEGVNPNEIVKIIRNDEIEKLQEISSQNNFNFDQAIQPSLYERCSFINQKNVSLVDYAAFFSAVRCFKHLLLNGANVNNTGKYAIAGGNLEIIHLCEQNHSSFEDAYQTAIQFHKNDIFHYIYENKLEQLNDKLGYYCVQSGNYEILLFLEQECIKINDDILYKIAKLDNLYIFQYFLLKNQIPKDIMIYCSVSNNIELVKFILEQKGIDINAKYNGKTALSFASETGNVEIVKLLLKQNEIDINTKGNIEEKTPLMLASKQGHTDVVKLLLEKEEIEINTQNKYKETALMNAFRCGNTEIIKLLLEKEGIEINTKNDRGETALMLAAQNNYLKIVKLLLEQKGIDINAKDDHGCTALMKALSYYHIEIVKILLEQKGIDVNEKNNDGQTPLMKVSLNGSIEIAKLLLKQEGIDVNAQDNKGNTALINASCFGNAEIVKLLLDHEGIDINAKIMNKQHFM